MSGAWSLGCGQRWDASDYCGRGDLAWDGWSKVGMKFCRPGWPCRRIEAWGQRGEEIGDKEKRDQWKIAVRKPPLIEASL